MILTGPEIEVQVRHGLIVLDPFSLDQLNPNSYNFRLDRVLRVYTHFPIDPRRPLDTKTVEVPDDGLELVPGRLYLASTVERMGSRHFVPTYAARSSVARLGIFINLSANLGDIGFIGQWTLQLLAVHPVRIYPFMEIGQIMFWRTHGDIVLYEGKYQGSLGPQASRILHDFIDEDEDEREWLNIPADS